jgi:hypothetical protein
MKADAFEVGSILRQRQRFEVPIYQRHYAWGDDRLEPFWEDVRTKADERLDAKPRRFAHYMGALLVMPEGGYQVGRVPTFNVVDGQQRLCTFEIFLAAIRGLALEWQFDDMAEELNVHLLNGDEKLMKEAANERYKLQPTKYDRKLFRDLINLRLDQLRERYADHFYQNGNLRKSGTPLPLWAWWFFRAQSATFAREDGNDVAAMAARLGELWKALLSDFKLVVITLDEGDDAQVIFETLNSRGEPLLAMDLVRNDVFHRATALNEDTEELFETKWQIFEDPFWNETDRQGRLNKPRIDFFLGHMLAAETGNDVTLTKLYSEYRAFVQPKRGEFRFSSVASELDTLTRYAPTYRDLVSPQGHNVLNWLAGRLKTWDVSTAYPLIFRISTDRSASADEKAVLYRLIHSYIVRRALCGLVPKNYNKTFLRVTAHLAENGVSVKSFAAAFSDQVGDTVRFPDDAELRRNILSRPIYGAIGSERLRLILEELERASRDKYDENVSIPIDLTVEHVLPDKWATYWPFAGNRYAPEDLITGVDEEMRALIDRREAAKNTLGNLTLLTSSANPSLSNLPFNGEPEQNKREFLRSSLLKMNQEIANCPMWDEAAIEKRAERLAALAIALWPIPAAAEATTSASAVAAE